MSAPDETAPQPQDAAPKPCPLCDAEMVWDGHQTEEAWLHPERVVPCLLQAIALRTDRQLAAWNRRAPSASEAALREALEQLLIGIGMGWDLDGLAAEARAALAAEGGAS
jgi:hypothetical protein